MSLVSVSEYKVSLSIDPADQNADSLLTIYQSEIEGWVKNYIGRDLETATYTEYYDGNGTNELILNQYPVTSVTKIEFYDGVVNETEVWTEQVLHDQFNRKYIRKTHTLILDGLTFPCDSQNIRITYVAGYTTMPPDIQKACKELMYLYYSEMKKEQQLGVSTRTTGAGATSTITYDKQEVQKILRNLDLHRNLNI